MVKFNAKLIQAKDALDNANNQDWWENNPMTYDWDKSLGDPTFTKEYFQSIDEIFGDGHSLVNNPSWPDGSILENFVPYDSFFGKQVLEIGCGAGLVSSHIARAGAELHAVDLTSQAIAITRKRFEMAGLKGDRRVSSLLVEWSLCNQVEHITGIDGKADLLPPFTQINSNPAK